MKNDVIKKFTTLIKEYETNQESIKTLTLRNSQITKALSSVNSIGKPVAKNYKVKVSSNKGKFSGIRLSVINLMQDGKIRTARQIAEAIEKTTKLDQSLVDKYSNAVSNLKCSGKLSVIGKAKWNKQFRLRYSPKPKKVEEKSVKLPKKETVKIGSDTKVTRIHKAVDNPLSPGGFGIQP